MRCNHHSDNDRCYHFTPPHTHTHRKETPVLDTPPTWDQYTENLTFWASATRIDWTPRITRIHNERQMMAKWWKWNDDTSCPSSRHRSTANQWNHNHNTKSYWKDRWNNRDWLFNRNWVQHFFPRTFPETISPWRLVCLSRFLRLVFRQAELSFCWTTLKLVSFSFHVSFNRCLVVGTPFSHGFLRPTPSNFFWYLQKEPQKSHHLQWKVRQIKEWMAVVIIIYFLFIRFEAQSSFVVCSLSFRS